MKKIEDKRIELFWQTKAGRRILSYGKLLVVSGIWSIFVGIGAFLFMVATLNSDFVLLGGQFFIMTILVVVAGFMQLIVGYYIWIQQMSPNAIKVLSLVILIVLWGVPIMFMPNILMFCLLTWIFVELDALLYLCCWLKKYRQAKNSTIKTLQESVDEYNRTRLTSTLTTIAIIMSIAFVIIVILVVLGSSAGLLGFQ